MRGPRRAAAWPLALVLLAGAACAPGHPVVSGTPTVVAVVSPSSAFDPLALGPNDCTAPPDPTGTTAHSSVLGASVILPAGWSEVPSDEGKQGAETAFALENGPAPAGAVVYADPFPTTMSPHEAVDWEISQPGSGTLVTRGDCTVAGSQAAYFESAINGVPGPGNSPAEAYSMYIAHRGALVRLFIDAGSSNGVATPAPRDMVMTQVKRILGSWRWDAA